jgi:hypothetical protein
VVIVFTSGSEETGGNKSKTAKLATFARNTPTKTRVSRRAIERDATRAKRLVVFGEIVETPLDKGAEINALAKLPSCPAIQDERGQGGRTQRDRRCLPCDRVGLRIDAGFKHIEPSMVCGNRIRQTDIFRDHFPANVRNRFQT